jgi:hypothetical protein
VTKYQLKTPYLERTKKANLEDMIVNSIFRQIEYVKYATKKSNDIIAAIADSDIERIISETDNRGRLIKIISLMQTDLEEKITKTKNQVFSKSLSEILSTWKDDFSNWINKMAVIDQNIVEGLETLKKETNRDISQTFKNRQVIQSYGSSNSKRHNDIATNQNEVDKDL